MPSYVSATFEKTVLPGTAGVRIIVRHLDQGSVPPVPSATYFPTDPDTLNVFGVIEYVNDVVGERWVRVATVADFSGLPELALDTLSSAAADFVTAGVIPGDVIELTIAAPSRWTSIEYPGTSPFSFIVTSVVDANTLRVTPPLPAFQANTNWSIPTRTINGNDGITHRTGSPAGPITFRDSRFNAFFSSAIPAENFVTATKAALDTLSTETNNVSLVNENYTGVPA